MKPSSVPGFHYYTLECSPHLCVSVKKCVEMHLQQANVLLECQEQERQSHKHFQAFAVVLSGLQRRRWAGQRRSAVNVGSGFQERLGGGRWAEERVIVEALERLQGQSEASAGFGGTIRSLSELENYLGRQKKKVSSNVTFHPTCNSQSQRQLPPRAGAGAG